MTTPSTGFGGGPALNLATLWLPVVAETSKIAGQMKEAGRVGGEQFKQGFQDAAHDLDFKVPSDFGTSFKAKISEIFNEPELPFGMGKLVSNFTKEIDEGVVQKLKGEVREALEQYKADMQAAAEATNKLSEATAAYNNLTDRPKEYVAGAAQVIPAMQAMNAAQAEVDTATAKAKESQDKYNNSLREYNEESRMTAAGSEALAGVMAGAVAFGLMEVVGLLDSVKEHMVDMAEEGIQRVLEVGEKFEDFEHQIALFTTASGEDFEKLNESVVKVAGELDTSTDGLGKTMALFAQRMQLSGPELEQFSYHVTELQDRFGHFDVDQLQAAMQVMGVAPKDADAALASLTQSARQSSSTIGDLIGGLSTAGPTLQAAGLNFQQAAAFAGELATRGVNSQQALTGLGFAEKDFAKNGLSFQDGLEKSAAKIKELHDAGDDIDADAMAEKLFGQRRWTQAIATVDAYLDVVKKGPDAYNASGDSLDQLIDKTRTWKDEWQNVQNTLDVALKPLGGAALDTITTVMDQIKQSFETHKDEIAADIKDLGDKFIDAIPSIQEFAADGIEILGQFANFTKSFLVGIGQTAAATGTIIGTVTGNTDLKNASQDLFDKLGDLDQIDFGNKADGISKWIKGLHVDTDTLKQKFDDAFTKGKDGSKDAADGIKGVGDAAKDSADKVDDLGQKTRDLAQLKQLFGQFGSQSPGFNPPTSGASGGGLANTLGGWFEDIFPALGTTLGNGPGLSGNGSWQFGLGSPATAPGGLAPHGFQAGGGGRSFGASLLDQGTDWDAIHQQAMSGDKASIAKSIYGALTAAGYGDQVALAAVSASMLESSLSTSARNAGHNSLFQTSADKGVPDDPASQIQWVLSEMASRGGPDAANNAPDAQDWFADNIERGGYPGSRYDDFKDQAYQLVTGTSARSSLRLGGGGRGLGASFLGRDLDTSGSVVPVVGAAGTSPNGYPLNAPEQGFTVNGVSAQDAAGGPAQQLQAFAQWFNDNIEPVKQLAGFDAGGHGLGDKSNHTSGTALDINWDDFTALQGNGADARTHFSVAQMQEISQKLTQMGMTWGQYWTPGERDPGHFELAGADYSKQGPQNIDPMTGQPKGSAVLLSNTFGINGGPTSPVDVFGGSVNGGFGTEGFNKQMAAQDQIDSVNQHTSDLQTQIDTANGKIGTLNGDIGDLNKKLADARKQSYTGDDDAGVQAVLKQIAAKNDEIKSATTDLTKLQRELADQPRKLTEAESKYYADQNKPLSGSEKTVKDPTQGIWEGLGGGLLKGIGQELGFGDIFGKAPWDWGIVKLLGGLAGWGIGTANAWSDEIGKGHTGMTNFQPLQGWDQKTGESGGGGLLSLLSGVMPGVKDLLPQTREKALSAQPNMVPAQTLPAQPYNPVGGPTGPAPGPTINGDYMPVTVTAASGDPNDHVNAWQAQQNAVTATAGGLPTPRN